MPNKNISKIEEKINKITRLIDNSNPYTDSEKIDLAFRDLERYGINSPDSLMEILLLILQEKEEENKNDIKGDVKS